MKHAIGYADHAYLSMSSTGKRPLHTVVGGVALWLAAFGMNEVNARQARLVLGWVIVFGWVFHLGM